MNRTFIVVSLYLSVKGNKIARSGDEVNESQLCSPADELIRGGYIREKQVQVGNLVVGTSGGNNDDIPPATNQNGGTIVLPLFTINRDGSGHDVRVIEDITKIEIVSLLNEHKEKTEGFVFNQNDNKETLFNILVPIMKSDSEIPPATNQPEGVEE